MNDETLEHWRERLATALRARESLAALASQLMVRPDRLELMSDLAGQPGGSSLLEAAFGFIARLPVSDYRRLFDLSREKALATYALGAFFSAFAGMSRREQVDLLGAAHPESADAPIEKSAREPHESVVVIHDLLDPRFAPKLQRIFGVTPEEVAAFRSDLRSQLNA